MRSRLVVLMFVGIVIFSCGQQDKSPATAQSKRITSPTELLGKNLFLQKCAACHAVQKELIGPPLAGAQERWNDNSRLYAFIKNAPKAIEEDKYAKDLWEKYNRTLMTPFPELTDADIDAIFEYVNAQVKQVDL